MKVSMLSPGASSRLRLRTPLPHRDCACIAVRGTGNPEQLFPPHGRRCARVDGRLTATSGLGEAAFTNTGPMTSQISEWCSQYYAQLFSKSLCVLGWMPQNYLPSGPRVKYFLQTSPRQKPPTGQSSWRCLESGLLYSSQRHQSIHSMWAQSPCWK